MGFNSVYRALQEVFPEIDTRLLRAVAIENSKDVDAAATDVLNEVIPHMADQSISGNSSAQRRKSLPAIDKLHPNGIPYKRAENMKQLWRKVEKAYAEPSSRSGFSIGESSKGFSFRINNDNTGSTSEPGCGDAGKDSTAVTNRIISITEVDMTGFPLVPDCPDVGNPVTVDSSTTTNDEPADKPQLLSHSEEGNDHLAAENLDEELIVLKGRNEIEGNKTVDAVSNGPSNEQVHVKSDENEALCYEINGVIDQGKNEEVVFTGRFDVTDSKEADSNVTDGFVPSDEQSINVDCTISEVMARPELVEIADSTVSHRANESEVSDEQSFNADVSVTEVSEVVPSTLTETADAKECELQSEGDDLNLSAINDYSFVEVGDNDNDFSRKSKQSGQICSTEFLDEIIEDAKNNKKNLFSVMESVMTLIEEVQLQERAADVAKEDAAKGGVDILVKVEEIKQMLVHAKEANDMHAGEVYGEKSILAAEARELQSRLLSLSDERDKSLSTLDEMRQTLEARLAAAEEMKRAAELEKHEKEESAREALAEQEAIMEKVVQESKVLEREAEENSKLQEFLVNRGRMLDVLQGEISVICEDVRLLKENFDNRIPLSMSVSSSQTTCKLASSASSLKSITSDKAPEEPESLCKSPVEGTSLASSVEKLSIDDEDLAKHDGKGIEDEWEIYDKEEEDELRV